MGSLSRNSGMALPALIFWICIVGGLGLLVVDIIKGKDSYEDKRGRGEKYATSTTTTSKGSVFHELGANLGLVKDAKWWSSPVKMKREEVTQVFVSYSSSRSKHKLQSGVSSYYVDQARQ